MNRIIKLLTLLLVFSILTSTLLFSASAASLASSAGTVSVSALNVRTDPNTTSPITATLSIGDTVVILDSQSDGWYHINCNGAVGYVAAQYISEVETAKNFEATGTLVGDDIRMRDTPSTAGFIVGTYSEGTVMSVIGINNGWYKVVFEGNTGYIRSDFLNIGTALEHPSSSLGQKIADYAQQFVGYSYIYGAASPDYGFDCSGLAYYVYKQFGNTISRTASAQYRNNGVSVSKADLEPGDLVFFSSNGGRSITHVGLYHGDGIFVHASTSSTGVILSDLDSAYYTRVYYGAKRIIG